MSALAEHAARYVAVRRAVGFKLSDTAGMIDSLVAHVERHGGEHLNVEMVTAWAGQAGSESVQLRRLSVARRFCAWLQPFDELSETVPKGLGPRCDYRRPPHIFSAGEVAGLIDEARRLQPRLWASSVSCAIGLDWSTGLRPGEIYRLRCGDFDPDTAELAVLNTKGGRSRLLPLHPSTTSALNEHLRLRKRLKVNHDHFFVTVAGAPMTSPALTPVFRRLVKQVGISVADGHRPARFGDLRHSFAVATLTHWHHTGVEVGTRLPALSAYLGHQSPANTYWYLQAVPELMAVVARRVARDWQEQP